MLKNKTKNHTPRTKILVPGTSTNVIKINVGWVRHEVIIFASVSTLSCGVGNIFLLWRSVSTQKPCGPLDETFDGTLGTATADDQCIIETNTARWVDQQRPA